MKNLMKILTIFIVLSFFCTVKDFEVTASDLVTEDSESPERPIDTDIQDMEGCRENGEDTPDNDADSAEASPEPSGNENSTEISEDEASSGHAENEGLIEKEEESIPENSSYYILGYEHQGWGYTSGRWYYFKEDYTALTGWLRLGEKWYYLNREGVMQTGLQTIAKKKYYLNASGAMETGWKYIDKCWYFFRAGSGEAQKGWLKQGTVWYYFNKDCIMLTGEQTIGGVRYYLNKDGSLRSGWRKIDGKWHYYSENGYEQKGWQKVDGIWYYMDRNGVMQTGWKEIGGNRYYLNSSGAMQTGWQKIEGTWYYLERSGRWAPELEHTFNDIKKYTNVPYIYGGNTDSGWDCSGFVQWAINKMNVLIPRTTIEQVKAGKPVDIKEQSSWKPGDLIFFTGTGYVSHVALYLGNGQMMHALNEKYGTYITGVQEYDEWDRYNALSHVRRILY